MGNFDINKAGFVIAGLFALVWIIALGYWKFARVETKWTTPTPAAAGTQTPTVDVESWPSS
jgi:high-affinity nickel-transport protein